jgi:hypothetical protein
MFVFLDLAPACTPLAMGGTHLLTYGVAQQLEK